ncbi:unnamed protein product [Ilex paraguariensis]|uniref:Exostosin GT47 domain-containing protein n=1 Tax=Ilex paraguariensis TaxID=185542 RepID=A0ABC8SSP7_9AQUA
MLSTFKIFIYTTPIPFSSSTPPFSLFHTSLVNSPFITQNPNEANLFFIPVSPDVSTRSLGRLVKDLRTNHPYWDRTLGADHFFLSNAGIEFSSDRNLLELKKNSIQITVFPTNSGNFVPHKDISLPPFNPSPFALPHAPVNNTTPFLGYLEWDGETESSLVNELNDDQDFVVESEPLDDLGRLQNSKFCVYIYGGDVTWMAEAMSLGCVPAVIMDRPIQDLPLMDILRWSEMAVFVGTRGGAGELKKVLVDISKDRYERMRGFAVTASQHLVWNSSPQPYDAFHMVVYQLWLRRHTIRYGRREMV